MKSRLSDLVQEERSTSRIRAHKRNYSLLNGNDTDVSPIRITNCKKLNQNFKKPFMDTRVYHEWITGTKARINSNIF